MLSALTLCVSSCATSHGGSSEALCSGLVFVEPDDTEVAALSNETAEAILQNNLVIAKLCGGE